MALDLCVEGWEEWPLTCVCVGMGGVDLDLCVEGWEEWPLTCVWRDGRSGP